MGKTAIDPKIMFHPRPAFLVGANVDGKPNFMVVVSGGGACMDPPMISVSIQRQRYTLQGIRKNKVFSVNLPSANMVAEFDYCGLVSGAKVDKAAACNLTVFYGKLADAPLVEQCPVNQVCKVEQILDLGSHSLVIGRVEETYVSESCFTDGKPDLDKINTIIFTQKRQYVSFGKLIAEAYTVGKKFTTGE